MNPVECCTEVIEYSEPVEIIEHVTHCELIVERSDVHPVKEIIEVTELVRELEYNPKLEIVTECAPGPRGRKGETGIPEIEMIYAKCVDFTEDGADKVVYRGEAVPGSDPADPVWRVRRITIGPDCDVKEEWADGDAEFDKSFDDRLSFTYS